MYKKKFPCFLEQTFIEGFFFPIFKGERKKFIIYIKLKACLVRAKATFNI